MTRTEINLQKVKEVRELINKGWCRKKYHRVIAGKHHYCILGACIKVGTGTHQFDISNPISFNDAQIDKRPVLAIIDRRIKELEQAIEAQR